MRYEVSQVDVFSVGKIAAVIYAACGLVAWLFLPIFILIPTGGRDDAVAKGMMIFFMLAAPLFYAILGFIAGLIAGFVYNLFSRSFGGLRVTLTQEVV